MEASFEFFTRGVVISRLPSERHVVFPVEPLIVEKKGFKLAVRVNDHRMLVSWHDIFAH